MTASTEEFRDAFRTHPAGVALITAEANGAPVGLTLSSLTSLSLDPLAVAFSMSKTSGSAGDVLAADGYVIHLLGDEHAELARAFSVSGGVRFDPAQGWARLTSGEPYLPSAPVAFRARTLDTVPVGAARLVAAEVLDVLHGPAAGRLVYQDRTFFTLDGARVR